MNLSEWNELVYYWHAHYHGLLSEFAKHKCDLPIADIAIQYKARRYAGKYIVLKQQCVYSLPHFIVLGEEFAKDTIAHELCHHAQYHLAPWATWHGDLFRYLHREICGFRNAKKCTFSLTTKDKQTIQQVSELLNIAAATGR